MKLQTFVVALAIAAVDGIGLNGFLWPSAVGLKLPAILQQGASNPLNVQVDSVTGPTTPAPTTATPNTTTPAPTTAAPATSLFALLASTAPTTTAPPKDGTIRNLDATDGLLIIEDSSTSNSGSHRRLMNEQDRDYTMHMMFCHGSSNSIQSYQSYQPESTTTPVYNPFLSDRAQGQCGKYIVKSETVAAQVGCNPQTNPNGCSQTYAPGCGGLAINPVTKDTYVARTGGRSIGRMVKVNNPATGTCQSRVVDWLVRYRGKRFNGPSDITFTKKGNLYFTDAPFGLAATQQELLSANLSVLDAKRELPFNGVYLRPLTGANQLIDCNMTRPKSIAFSPAQDVLYVANADVNDPYVKKFDLGADGAPVCSRRFFDLAPYVPVARNASCARTYPTALKVDGQGFVYVAMCRNVYIVSTNGTYLGRLEGTDELRNLAFSQGYLYLTAMNNLYALPLPTSFNGSQPVVANGNACDAPVTQGSPVKAAAAQDTYVVVQADQAAPASPVADEPASSAAVIGVGAAGLVAGVAALAYFKNKKAPRSYVVESPAMTPRNLF